MMTTQEVRALLRKMYSAPHWVFMEEARNATGFNATRSADALALGLFQSHGQHLHGFEIKVSRNDWLNELKKPEKSHDIAQFCDFWYLVVSDEAIVKNDLPAPWGMIAPTKKGDKLRMVKRPDKLKPIAPDRTFLTALVKAAVDETARTMRLQYGATDIDQRVHDAANSARELADARHESNIKSWREERDKLRNQIRDFQIASGINIHEYHPFKEMGQALRMVLDGDAHIFQKVNGMVNAFDHHVFQVEQTTGEIRASLDGLKKLRDMMPTPATMVAKAGK